MAFPNQVTQQAQVDALLAKYEPIIRDAFLAAIRQAGNSIDRRALISALNAGDIEAAVALFRIDQGVMYPLQEAVRSAYIAGGQSLALAMPKSVLGQFGFNGAHLRAEAYLSRFGADMVTNVSEDAMSAARETILESLSENVTTRTTALRLTGRAGPDGVRQGGVIGLTRPQEQSIVRGMSELSSGNAKSMSAYLDRKERDLRFDPMIKRAIADGRILTPEELARIEQGHRSKSLKLRGQRVARNETFTAQAAGRHEGWLQILERPDIDGVTVRWQHNLSQKPRKDHVAMDGTIIQIGEYFIMGDGTAMAYPHDPRGGATHSVGCRCIAIYRPVLPKR